MIQAPLRDCPIRRHDWDCEKNLQLMRELEQYARINSLQDTS
jgi:hypothetical protein